MHKFIWLSTKRLVGSFNYKVKRAFLLPVKPVFINFPITYKCNSRCTMCDIWRRYIDNPQEVKNELTLKDLKRFFTENKDWLSGVRHLGITGGEALLRTDLVEVIKLMRKELPLAAVGIQTNGLVPGFTIKKIKEILAFYPELSLAVSLDGLEKTHEKVRGVKNAYQNALTTIKLAREAGVKDITTGMTVTDVNADEIMKVKEVSEKYGCEFSAFLADEGDYFNNLGKNPGLKGKAKKTVINSLKNFSYHYFMDNLRLQITGIRKRRLPCYSGWTSLVIDPFGEVKPCILRSESFGNIKNQKLGEMLSSKNALEIRRMIKKCSCWSQCEVSTSAVVDPWDVLVWFVFYADKKAFIQKMLKKTERID